ncbi:MAG: hypothetical protein M1831_004054 [Alyxoria varia]|nr:MAG: hypothetical protein M1831_004054 [Alyxoria varia]
MGLMVTEDASTDLLYVIDTDAGKSRKVYQDDKLAGKNKLGKGAAPSVRNRRFYVTNASKGLLATLAIDVNTGDAAKGAEGFPEGK